VYCSKCGSAIAAGGTFCSNCGQPIAAAVVQVPAFTSGVASPVGGFPVQAVAAEVVPSYRFTVVYAGFWLRFVAHMIDTVILGICLGPVIIGLALAMGIGTVLSGLPRNRDVFETGFPPVFFGFISLIALIGLCGGWLYFALLESSHWQATAGKKALGLKVTDYAGARNSFARASGRHFAKIISGMIPLGIGYIIAGFTEKKQAIHDMLASCLVVRG
jgi:uncharacterized RDD family membrane protein YckC